MSIKIIKVEKDHTKIIKSIIEDLLSSSDQRPSTGHFQKLLSDDRTFLFVAISDEKAIGYILAYKFPSLYSSDYLAYLYDIEVLASYRRKGVGRRLIEALNTHLKSVGVTEVWLGTAVDNQAGQALFTSSGGLKSEETFNEFTYELTP